MKAVAAAAPPTNCVLYSATVLNYVVPFGLKKGFSLSSFKIDVTVILVISYVPVF